MKVTRSIIFSYEGLSTSPVGPGYEGDEKHYSLTDGGVEYVDTNTCDYR